MTINPNQLDEELRQKLMDLQNLQNNLEFIVNQRIQLESQLKETELAIEELEKTSPEETVYKSIGGIMVKSNKDKLLSEKKNDKATAEMRVKTLKQKEERTRNQLQQLSQTLQSELQQKQST
ncbi:MAG: prefoldin subunit beta [Promethearchaeota archaeon]|nr:MAG: prefoldin subunit beta [Candidatus Lokiarchaeota archaeon]